MTPPTVVHISGDFPDVVDSNKTKVVGVLLGLTDGQFKHKVYSLNRVALGPAAAIAGFAGTLGNPRCQIDWHTFGRGFALEYFAPGRGLLHATFLKAVGAHIADHLRADPPGLLVGHKLTIEGIVTSTVAREIGRPYAITIQGDTDTKILAARPDLRKLFARIYHDAAHVFSFAPWALEQVQRRLGVRSGPITILPCPTELDAPLPPRPQGKNLVSAFHLMSRRRKNLKGMTEAMSGLADRGVKAEMVVYGGGSAADERAAARIVSATPSVRLGGSVERQKIPLCMNQGIGFVLPSRRETFGLVFVEALFAGVPIVYPRGQGVSGYFDDAPFALSVNAADVDAITSAIATLVGQEDRLKAALADWQSSEHALRFRRPQIGDAFARGLHKAIGAQV